MDAPAPAPTVQASRRQTLPVLVWASIGAIALGFIAWIFGSWMLSDDFRPTVPPVEVPQRVLRFVFWGQVVSVGGAIVFLWLWLVKPWLRDGQPSFMGLLTLASMTCYFQDVFPNFYSFHIAYNSAMLNLGTWGHFIPGWSTPDFQRFPEMIAFAGAGQVWFNLGPAAAMAGMWAWLMRRAPQSITPAQIIIILIATFTIFDIVQEIIFLRMEIFAYVGAVQSLSIFGGHFYQMPVYVALFTAFYWFGMSTLIRSHRENGISWAERGIDQLRVSPGLRNLIRFLALAGAMHTVVMVTMSVPSMLMSIQGDRIPDDTPAYLINGLCGPEAPNPCPARGEPLPRSGG